MPAGIHLFRVNVEKLEQTVKKKNSKSTIKTPERQNKLRFGVLIVNFEEISDLVLVLFFLTLNI